jgi:hypothetical protein
MKLLAIGLLLMMGGLSRAEVVSCPAMKEGKKLTDASFFEGSSPIDKTALEPNQSRVEGENWFQSWDMTHVNERRGLQMVCKYRGIPAGTFIMVKKASVCTLTKKSGVVVVGWK